MNTTRPTAGDRVHRYSRPAGLFRRTVDDLRGTGDFQRLRGAGDLIGSQPFPALTTNSSAVTIDSTLDGHVDFGARSF